MRYRTVEYARVFFCCTVARCGKGGRLLLQAAWRIMMGPVDSFFGFLAPSPPPSKSVCNNVSSSSSRDIVRHVCSVGVFLS